MNILKTMMIIMMMKVIMMIGTELRDIINHMNK